MYNKRHEFWQVSEGRIIAALRDEVTAAEVRLEEERAAHTTTQRTAAAREQVPLLPFSPPPCPLLHLHPLQVPVSIL